MKKFFLIFWLIFACQATASVATEKLSYKSFNEMLLNGKLTKVVIYDYGQNVDAVAYDPQEKEYLIKGPVGLNEDHVLHSVLQSQSIEYQILDEKYKGPGSKGNADFFNYAKYFSLIMWVTPLLGIAVIFILANIIAKQNKTIRELIKK